MTAELRPPDRQVTNVGRGSASRAATCCRARSMSSTRGGSETTFTDVGTAPWTSAYDIPPSIAANSSPQRYSQDAASDSRAKALGSAIMPRLYVKSVGTSKSCTSCIWSALFMTSTPLVWLVPSVRLGHDPDVRLGLLPVTEDLLRLVVADRAGDDDVLALLPVDRRGDPVAGRQL